MYWAEIGFFCEVTVNHFLTVYKQVFQKRKLGGKEQELLGNGFQHLEIKPPPSCVQCEFAYTYTSLSKTLKSLSSCPNSIFHLCSLATIIILPQSKGQVNPLFLWTQCIIHYILTFFVLTPRRWLNSLLYLTFWLYQQFVLLFHLKLLAATESSGGHSFKKRKKKLVFTVTAFFTNSCKVRLYYSFKRRWWGVCGGVGG